ncbi:hypothetical protein PR048_019564 [Dryococelus australis]|uniref:Uncharacterized protein n=1 Tax=Dryococelus australis TaxID=614101 RepID=A0ABQ9H3V5_9NEOP|nr:hypothetical protein PR048_019564 [Dryococelus australis]
MNVLMRLTGSSALNDASRVLGKILGGDTHTHTHTHTHTQPQPSGWQSLTTEAAWQNVRERMLDGFWLGHTFHWSVVVGGFGLEMQPPFFCFWTTKWPPVVKYLIPHGYESNTTMWGHQECKSVKPRLWNLEDSGDLTTSARTIASVASLGGFSGVNGEARRLRTLQYMHGLPQITYDARNILLQLAEGTKQVGTAWPYPSRSPSLTSEKHECKRVISSITLKVVCPASSDSSLPLSLKDRIPLQGYRCKNAMAIALASPSETRVAGNLLDRVSQLVRKGHHGPSPSR